MDFARLRVRRLIVHEVPGKSGFTNQLPSLSTAETKLSSKEEIYFTKKIIDNLSRASFEAKFMPNSESPIPKLIVDDFFKSHKNESFVAISQTMANYLYECQTRVNSPGVLAVIEVSISERPALAILKLEKEEGIRIEQVEQDRSSEEVSFEVKYISNILLSEKTKIFKTGLFLLNGETINISNIDVYVSDNQNSRNSRVANFFLEKYLGCHLKVASSVMTQKFFDETESFINKFVENPEEQADYYLALFAELRSENGDLSPESFTDKYLKADKKIPYLNQLEKAGVSTNKFTKDTELIKSRLSKVQLVCESGIIIISPSTAFDNQLKLSDYREGKVHIEIKDKVKQFKGK
jgi:hypothetical protein